MATKIEIAMKKSEPMTWARLDLPAPVSAPTESKTRNQDSDDGEDEWWRTLIPKTNILFILATVHSWPLLGVACFAVLPLQPQLCGLREPLSHFYHFCVLPVFFLSFHLSSLAIELCEMQQDFIETFFFFYNIVSVKYRNLMTKEDLWHCPLKKTTCLIVELGTLASHTYTTFHASCTHDVIHDHHYL